MASVTTSNLGRNALIRNAYRKIGVARGELSGEQQATAVELLNLIIREEDAIGLGSDRHLWAMDRGAFPLVVRRAVYTGSVAPGLNADIKAIEAAWLRDLNGEDTPLEILSTEQYAEITEKDAIGDPERIWFDPKLTRSAQAIYVHPQPSTVGTPSTVVGSDGAAYACILGHTAALQNKPISGADWPVFWTPLNAFAATWTGGTAYVNAKTIVYDYKRPLADFSNATDNPDFPQEWTRYLSFRLAYDLSADYALSLDERQWLKQEYVTAREVLFPSTRERTNTHHDKALYF